ncbi:hypothetical protein D6833_13905 [Candidatus Parcubacteria bacterium]|nr:MAG: hypothetical protein D6833_13905 [Candidatus Parcubacteria bacterium]
MFNKRCVYAELLAAIFLDGRVSAWHVDLAAIACAHDESAPRWVRVIAGGNPALGDRVADEAARWLLAERKESKC